MTARTPEGGGQGPLTQHKDRGVKCHGEVEAAATSVEAAIRWGVERRGEWLLRRGVWTASRSYRSGDVGDGGRVRGAECRGS